MSRAPDAPGPNGSPRVSQPNETPPPPDPAGTPGPPEPGRQPPRESIWQRGAGWVLAQFPLGGLALLAALVGPELPAAVREQTRWPALALIGAGGALFVAGALSLGRSLTPFPKPRPDTRLNQGGAYRLVRHPIYAGGLIAVVGWALLQGRWLGLLATLALGVFFDAKARREERWLTAQFPEYPAYQRRVRRLIPFIY